MITTNDARNMAVKMLSRFSKRYVDATDDNDIANALSLEVLSTEIDGSFSIVTVKIDGHEVTGVAKRNPLDERDDQRGIRLATARAIRKGLML